MMCCRSFWPRAKTAWPCWPKSCSIPKRAAKRKSDCCRGIAGTATPTSSVRILRGLLKDKSAAVRAAALDSLRSVRAKELVPDLIDLLTDQAVLEVQSDYKGDDPYYVARARAIKERKPFPH